MSGFTFNGKHNERDMHIRYAPTEQERAGFFAKYNIQDMDFETKNGGLYYKTTLDKLEMKLPCFYEEITKGEREKILRWLDPTQRGELIFDDRPYCYYDVVVGAEVSLQEYPTRTVFGTRYSGILTITFVAHDPSAKLFYNTTDNDYGWQMDEETDAISNSQMPISPDPNGNSFLVYNPGSRECGLILKLCGDTGDKSITFCNETTGQKCTVLGLTTALTSTQPATKNYKGVNLLDNAGFENGTAGWEISKGENGLYYIDSDREYKTAMGKQFTFSVWMIHEMNETVQVTYSITALINGVRKSYGTKSMTVGGKAGNTQLTTTATIEDGATQVGVSIKANKFDYNGKYLCVYHPKLEVGAAATEWSLGVDDDFNGVTPQKWVEIDGETMQVFYKGNATSMIDYSYHDDGYISLVPAFPVEKDVYVSYKTHSGDVQSKGKFNKSMEGQYMQIGGDWRRILLVRNPNEAVIQWMPEETATQRVIIATLNRITITKGEGARLTYLDIDYHPKVR